MNKKISQKINQGLILMDKGIFHEALIIFEKLLKSFPNNHLAKLNFGICKFNLNDFLEAAKIFHQLHLGSPEDFNILKYAGTAYMRAGAYEISIKFFKKALSIQPKDFEILSTLSHLHILTNKEVDAVYLATEALSINPLSSNAYNNLGGCLLAIDRPADALSSFQTAINLDPNNFHARANLGTSYDRMGDWNNAIEAYKRCISELNLSKDQAIEIRYKMSMPLLASGNQKDGWDGYEAGLIYEHPSSRNPKRKFSVPMWQGDNIIGKRLLVWREQGLGDELVYFGLVSLLNSYCDHITLECDDRLISLFENSFPQHIVRPQSYSKGIPHEELMTDFDYHIPVGSLASIFSSKFGLLPQSKPYLKPVLNRTEEFKSRLLPFKKDFLIGICWRSGLNNSVRNKHYTPISDWESIFKIPNVKFVNLQYGDCIDELNGVKEHFGVDILNFEDLDLKNDLHGVAALIKNLDCVISAGTAVASLAAAVGTNLKLYCYPAWSLLGKKEYPWFPNVNLYLVDHSKPLKTAISEISTDLTQSIKNRA